MAAASGELEPILPLENRSTRYESLDSRSSYPTTASGPGSEENSSKKTPLGASNRSYTNIRHGWSWKTVWQGLKNLPDRVYLSRYTALVCVVLLLWANTYIIAGDAAGPRGQLFWIGVLGVAAFLAGCAVRTIGLPPLLGMLFTGIVLRNTGVVVLTDQYLDIAAGLRKVALVIILLRSGLGLDSTTLKTQGSMVFRLAVFPALMEVTSIAAMSHLILDLPWPWSCLLGLVLVASSSAVVTPCLLSLQDRGYGKSKGITTLVIAASSFDDFIAITFFSGFVSAIFSTDDFLPPIIQSIIGLICGCMFGIIWGLLLHYVPEGHDRFLVILRTLLLGAGGILFFLASEAYGFGGAGSLGCIVAALVANHGWRSQGWSQVKNPVTESFAVLWTICQPVLLGLIGNEIDLYFLDLKTVGLGCACLAVSLTTRIFITVAAASGGPLNLKEELFVSFARLPKATVQAAIGPVALDIAREIESEEYEVYATKVLIVAVLAILITAPIGASLITVLGPRLLDQEPTPPPPPSTSPELQTKESLASDKTIEFP